MRRTYFIALFLAIALMMPTCISAVRAGEVHIVAMVGDLAKLKTMLKDNPDLVNAKDESGNTPLHFAYTPEIALLLLDNKADIEAKEDSGGTPLHAAVNAGHVDVARLLLAHGADVNAKSVTGLTPLHIAASTEEADGKEKAAEMAELLLANKADLRAKDVDGYTPLDWAVAKSRPELATVLLSHIQKTLDKVDGGIRLQFKFTKGETMKLEEKTLMQFFSGLLDTEEGTMLTVQRVRNQVESTGPTTMLNCCTEAMRMESPPGTVVFDSDNEANRDNPKYKSLTATLGVPIHMELKPSGEVVSIDDSALKEKLTKSGSLDALNNIKTFEENLLEGTLVVLPDELVKTNGTWKTSMTHTLAGMGRLKSEYIFTLLGSETISGQRCAWFSISGSHSLTADADLKNPSQLGKSTVAGYALFSLDRGRIINSKIGENLHLMTPVPGEAPRFNTVRTYTIVSEKQ